MQRYVVQTDIYHALLMPPTELKVDDQFAFRPTGSTNAALITLIRTVIGMLVNEQYVRVFLLHSTFQKLSML
jgi:hypothetical protein